MPRWKVAFVASIIAFILIISSLLVPWWTRDSRSQVGPIGAKETIDYKLTEMRVRTYVEVPMLRITSDRNLSYSDVDDLDSIKWVFSVTLLLVMAALVMTLAQASISLFAGLRLVKGPIPFVASLVALIASIAVSAYFAFVFPSAYNTDYPSPFEVSGFIGSDEERGISWGPNYGWYAVLAASVLLLVSSIFSRPEKMALRSAT